MKRISLALSFTLAFLFCLGEPLKAQSPAGDLGSLLRQAKQSLSSRNVPEAIAVYEQAAYLAQDNDQIWASLGYLYVHQSRFLEAVTAYQRALAIDPENPHYYDGLGFSYGHLGALDKAWTAYASAINLEPSNLKYHLALGVVWLRLGEYDRLETLCSQILALDPNNSTAFLLRGSALVQRGAWDQAIAFLSAPKTPKNLELALQLAKAQAGKGDLVAAKATLTPWFGSHPTHGGLWLIWGLLLEQEKNYAQALASYEKAWRFNPQSWEALLAVGRTHLTLDNPRAALRYLMPLAQKYAQNGDVLYFLGLAYYRTSQTQQGLLYLQQAREIYKNQGNQRGVAQVEEILAAYPH